MNNAPQSKTGDPLKDIQGSAASIPVNIHAQAPEVVEEVQNFLNAKRDASGDEAVHAQGPEIPPNTDFVQETANDSFLTEALVNVDVKNIDVTDMEKRVFLKALVSETPCRLEIALMGGAFTVELRTRSQYEQQRLFDMVDLDIKEEVIPKTNYALQTTRFQQYCMALMVERINKKLFSDITLAPGTSIAEEIKPLRKFVADHFEKQDNIRWTTVLNAMRIFETKIARLNSEAANESFWKPRS